MREPRYTFCFFEILWAKVSVEPGHLHSEDPNREGRCLMKAPLLLSAHLPDMVPALLSIINNTEVIQINQDSAGVQARKLVVDRALPLSIVAFGS